MELSTRSRPKRISVEAVVTHADGSVTDYGEIAVYHRNPFLRLWAQIRGKGRVRSS